MVNPQVKINRAVNQEAVLVTGASGYIGKFLVKSLSNKGNTVVSMYRQKISEPLTNVYPICSDLSNIELLGVPLRGVETVVHLAWEKNYLGTDGVKDFSPSNENPSKNLLNLYNLVKAMEQSKAKRIIFLSSLGASRNSDHNFLKEKFLAEGLILNSKIEEKIIIRTSMVYGGEPKNDPFVSSIFELLKYPGFYPIPYPKLSLKPTHIDDLVKFICKLLQRKPQEGSHLIDYFGKDEITTEELLKLLMSKNSYKAKIPLKGSLGLSLLYLLEGASGKNDSKPNVRNYLSVGNQLNPSKIKNENKFEDIIFESNRKLRDSFGSY